MLKPIVGAVGLLIAAGGGYLTFQAYGAGGDAAVLGEMQQNGIVTAATAHEIGYTAPQGANENSVTATNYTLSMRYSRSEGIPFKDVLADESKLPTKQQPIPPPPFARANDPSPSEMRARMQYVEAEEPALAKRTDEFQWSTDRKGFDDAQPMDRHDAVYLKDKADVTPRRYEEVKAHEPAKTNGPLALGLLIGGALMALASLFIGGRKAA